LLVPIVDERDVRQGSPTATRDCRYAERAGRETE
jgi:hypothetical protein